ncbi:hypothetical protein RJV14_00315 [Buchnera aphidicola (Kurisakia onigurumii)]|uniref:hypothetical protein n=1 Tax=Buchnera aphidicola TaxID=9 RepID=UPI0031B739BD
MKRKTLINPNEKKNTIINNVFKKENKKHVHNSANFTNLFKKINSNNIDNTKNNDLIIKELQYNKNVFFHDLKNKQKSYSENYTKYTKFYYSSEYKNINNQTNAINKNIFHHEYNEKKITPLKKIPIYKKFFSIIFNTNFLKIIKTISNKINSSCTFFKNINHFLNNKKKIYFEEIKNIFSPYHYYRNKIILSIYTKIMLYRIKQNLKNITSIILLKKKKKLNNFFLSKIEKYFKNTKIFCENKIIPITIKNKNIFLIIYLNSLNKIRILFNFLQKKIIISIFSKQKEKMEMIKKKIFKLIGNLKKKGFKIKQKY